MTFTRFCAGLLMILLIAVVLVALGRSTAAWLVSYSGTLLYMVAVMAWIAVFDSRSRWPDASAWQRFTYVITFKR